MQNITRKLAMAQLRSRVVTRMASRAIATEAQTDQRRIWLAAAAASALGMTALSFQQEQPAAMEQAAPKLTDNQIHPNNYPPARPDLPTYTMEEVAEHADEDSLWYTFR